MKFWTELASRLKHFDPDLTMFEIINEPVFKGREEEWNALNQRLAAAIRKAAPDHTIMTSGPNWGGIDGLRKLKLLDDPNVVYSFHCYDPSPSHTRALPGLGRTLNPCETFLTHRVRKMWRLCWRTWGRTPAQKKYSRTMATKE